MVIVRKPKVEESQVSRLKFFRVRHPWSDVGRLSPYRVNADAVRVSVLDTQKPTAPHENDLLERKIMMRRTTLKLLFVVCCLVSGTVCLAAASFLSSERGFATSHLRELLATRTHQAGCVAPLDVRLNPRGLCE